MPPRLRARTKLPTLTPAQQERLRRQAAVQAARMSLIDFVRLVFPGYEAGWFHFELCRRLEAFSAAVAAGKSPRLAVSVPPQHGKSTIISQIWPVWHMARYPRTKFVCASYAAELATDHSRVARDLARSPEAQEVFPALEIAEAGPDIPRRGRRPDPTDRLDKWAIGNKSTYYAVGVGGSLTGKGATVLVIDDPFKDWKEAQGAAARRDVHMWYQSTALTRLAPGGGVLIVQTRWHEDDLVGFVQSRVTDPSKLEPGEDYQPWEVINYPAIAERREKYRRVGDVLHEARYDLGELLARKRALGERIFAALYQGRPTPEGGGMFKREWFGNVFDTDPKRLASTLDEVFISYDCAAKKGADNDYTAPVVMGRKGALWYILAVRVDRMSFPELVADFRRMCAEWPEAKKKLVEDASAGTSLIQEVHGSIPGVIAVRPSEHGGKATRANATAVAAEAGQLFLPSERHVPAVGRLVEEHVTFPAAAHDDIVDAVSQVLNYAAKPNTDGPTAEERKRRDLAWIRAFGG
jgi:predicted phage terminase large subunit-like protein